MLAPPARPKRPRSPSPDFDEAELTSPLDVLIKRRRRSENPHEPGPSDYAGRSGYGGDADLASGDGEADALLISRPGVERRRTKQWERLNGPLPLSSQPSPHLASVESMQDQHNPYFASTSQPLPHASPNLSPLPRWYSQPDPPPPSAAAQMSSSPIQHQPPTSSPFRGSSDTRVGWDPEELGSEWGGYAAQNSLLYSLHRARVAAGPSTTPDTSLYQTSSHEAGPANHWPAHSPLAPTPYRQHPASSSTHIPSSSPFQRFQPSSDDHDVHPYATGDGEDDAMEVLADEEESGGSYTGRRAADEVKRRYEETNKLLAELDVARRRRWGNVGVEGEGYVVGDRRQ